jgi:tRNA pseudouridine32 synthase / 23S rRNA pseudouridine746 synthase
MDIIHQDEHILVIDKPAGLPVLPDGWEKDAPYLVKMLEEEFGKTWIVHRLDKVTSGVMVFARTAEAHRALNIQFEDREADKVYHAIVEGEPKWKEKTAKHSRCSRMWERNIGRWSMTKAGNRPRRGSGY